MIAPSGFIGFITGTLLPSSFVEPFVENEILQVLVLALLTSAAVCALTTTVRMQVVAVFDVISKILFGVIRMIMWLAPLGAFGGMAFTVAQFGSGALANLAKLAIVFWATAFFFVFVILGGVARVVGGFSIFKFVRLLKDELLILLGTSSSETVLPRLLVKLEAAGAQRDVVGVVIPTGYAFNSDGGCLYLTLGALFIVQAAGADLSLGQEVALVALMLLTSKGAAGVLGQGLIALVVSLQAFGGDFFTPEAIAVGISLVVGIDPRHERGPRAGERDRQLRGHDDDRQARRRTRRRPLRRRAREPLARRPRQHLGPQRHRGEACHPPRAQRPLRLPRPPCATV